jgi:hypothetical protein
MVNYEGMNYLVAAAAYKITHPLVKIEYVPMPDGIPVPERAKPYDYDRAKVFYRATTGKVIEIRRG